MAINSILKHCILCSLFLLINICDGDKVAGEEGENYIEWDGESCPKGATGQFPYLADCKRFYNCWKGRGMLSVCAPGTLFNPDTLECDYPAKVTCLQYDAAGTRTSRNQQLVKTSTPKDTKNSNSHNYRSSRTYRHGKFYENNRQWQEHYHNHNAQFYADLTGDSNGQVEVNEDGYNGKGYNNGFHHHRHNHQYHHHNHHHPWHRHNHPWHRHNHNSDESEDYKVVKNVAARRLGCDCCMKLNE